VRLTTAPGGTRQNTRRRPVIDGIGDSDMSDSTIPTTAERDILIERVCIARCLSRRPKQWPNESAIQKEKSALTFEAAQNGTVCLPTATAASAFLRSLGLIVPPLDAPRRD
jgi:hypothetical protein